MHLVIRCTVCRQRRGASLPRILSRNPELCADWTNSSAKPQELQVLMGMDVRQQLAWKEMGNSEIAMVFRDYPWRWDSILSGENGYYTLEAGWNGCWGEVLSAIHCALVVPPILWEIWWPISILCKLVRRLQRPSCNECAWTLSLSHVFGRCRGFFAFFLILSCFPGTWGQIAER